MERARVSAVVDAGGRLVHRSTPAPVAWWSFTKTLSATVALRLAGEGALDLDEPLPHARYTLRQLLSHTAGLPDYGALPAYQEAVAAAERPWDVTELLARAAAETLLFEPGHGWRYSNIGYLLARRRMEAVSGRTLGRLLRDIVFDPLALEAPRLAETPEDMAGLVAPPPHSYEPGWAYPGTVIGPVADAALCLHAILEGTVLSPGQRREMLTARPVGTTLPGRPWTGIGYGLGIAVGTMTYDGSLWEACGHGAAGPGSCGGAYRLCGPSGRRTVAVFGDFGSEGDSERRALSLASR